MIRVLCWKCAGHNLPRHARGCPQQAQQSEPSVPETVPRDAIVAERTPAPPELAEGFEHGLEPEES
jgi:hypothetical protein